MDIVRERLEREYDLELLATTPNVEYHAYLTNGTMAVVRNPSEMPDEGVIERVEEPYVARQHHRADARTWARSWSSARGGAPTSST